MTGAQLSENQPYTEYKKLFLHKLSDVLYYKALEHYAINYLLVHMATGVRRISPYAPMSSLLRNAQVPCSNERPRACEEPFFCHIRLGRALHHSSIANGK